MSLILGTKFADPVELGYSKEQLELDLASGVASVVAGIGSDYRLNVDTTAAAIVISHKDAVFKGTATVGSNKPALGITSAGIAMGFNRESDGVWVDTVAIASNGTASFAGTVNASGGNIVGSINVGDSLILSGNGAVRTLGKDTYANTTAGFWLGRDSSVYKLNIGDASSSLKWDGSALLLNGTAVGTIISGAAAGATSVQPAAIAGMLKSDTSYVLTGVITPSASGAMRVGTITWNPATGAITGGTGVAVTSQGIVGALAGVETFALTAAGNARFKGDISGATGTFSGTVSASNITGGTVSAAVSIQTTGYILSLPSGQFSSYNAAVWGEPQGSGVAESMYGVVGKVESGNLAGGVLGVSYSSSAPGVVAANYGGGFALAVDGKSSFNNDISVAGTAKLGALSLDHTTSTALSVDTTSAGLSSHATHNLSSTYYKSGVVPTSTTAPYLYFWNAGKVVGFINGVGAYGTA